MLKHEWQDSGMITLNSHKFPKEGPQADTSHVTLSWRSRAQPSWMSAAMTSVFPTTVARCKAVWSPCRVTEAGTAVSSPSPALQHSPHYSDTRTSVFNWSRPATTPGGALSFANTLSGNFKPNTEQLQGWPQVRVRHSPAAPRNGSVQRWWRSHWSES